MCLARGFATLVFADFFNLIRVNPRCLHPRHQRSILQLNKLYVKLNKSKFFFKT